MFVKYINRYQKAEPEWVHEVLDMHAGDQQAAFHAVLAAVKTDVSTEDPFVRTVHACCFASRHWWWDGLARLKQLGVIQHVDVFGSDGQKMSFLWANLQPLPAATRDWYRAAGDVDCPVCGFFYRLHPEDPADVDLIVLCNGDRVKL